jgi:hypothetical protein
VLALKLMRRRAGVFVAVFGVVALLAALSVGLSGYINAAATAGVRAGVAALTGADGGFRVSVTLSQHPEAQDASVRADVRAAVKADGRSVPMTVSRDVVSPNAVPLDRDHGAPARSALASIPDLKDRARLISGQWPSSPSEASMQADAAAALNVEVGDVLTLPGGAPVTITATWRVGNASDPRWLEDPVALTGIDLDSTPGWVVIDPSQWAGTGVPPVARWTVRPSAGHVTVSQLEALRHAPDTVSQAVQKHDPDSDVRVYGVLQLGIAPIQQNVQSAAAVSAAPLVVVALLGLITLIEVSGMLQQLRLVETALLRARGTSRRRFIGQAIAEGLVTAVPAAALGAGAATWWLAGQGAMDDIPAFAWVVAAATALVAVVVLAVAAARSSRDVLRSSRIRDGIRSLGGSTRVRSTAGIGVLLLLVLLAVVAVSQFLLYGSPLAPTSGGGLAIDPLAVSALALGIAAIGLLAIALYPLVARGLERLSTRAHDLGSLALQQLARRPRSALTPVLVLAFAVSGLILGASYSGTWSVSSRETRQVQVGTSVRVTSSPPLTASITRAVPGQRAASPVAREDAQLGPGLVSILGIPSDRIAAAVAPVDDAVDPHRLARLLRSAPDRPQIPASASGVAVSFPSSPETDRPVSGSLIIVDSVGAETAVNLFPDGDRLTGQLPSGVAPWTVHGIRLLLPPLGGGETIAVRLTATGASTTEIPLDASWMPSDGSEAGPVVAGPAAGRAGLRVTKPGPAGFVLLQSVHPHEQRLPVVISRELAEDAGLVVGSEAPMLLVSRGGTIPVKVAAVVPVIPGIESGNGIVADLGALQDAAEREGLLRVSTGEWWVSTTSPKTAAARERRAHPEAHVDSIVPSADEQVLESARVVVWIAGIVTALLALLAIWAGLLAELRSRADEVRVLRAVGVRPGVQSAGRVREWAMLLGFGVLVGVVDGVVVCALLVPSLARTAVPNAIGALRTSLNVDGVGLLAAAAAVLVASALLLAVIARAVRSQSRLSGRASAATRSGMGSE